MTDDLSGSHGVIAVSALVLASAMVGGCATTLSSQPTDAAITARVKTALLNDPGIAGSPIEVDTLAGIVTLTGTIGSRTAALRAERVARSIDGVTDVRSRLQIMP